MLITKFTTIFDANCRKKETVSGTRTDAEIPIELYLGIEPVRPAYIFAYTSLICDGHHQKRECDTNFFVCLLVSRYRIDAPALPPICLRATLRFKDRFLHA